MYNFYNFIIESISNGDKDTMNIDQFSFTKSCSSHKGFVYSYIPVIMHYAFLGVNVNSYPQERMRLMKMPLNTCGWQLQSLSISIITWHTTAHPPLCYAYTANKIQFMYYQKRNYTASFPIHTFMYL